MDFKVQKLKYCAVKIVITFKHSILTPWLIIDNEIYQIPILYLMTESEIVNDKFVITY